MGLLILSSKGVKPLLLHVSGILNNIEKSFLLRRYHWVAFTKNGQLMLGDPRIHASGD